MQACHSVGIHRRAEVCLLESATIGAVVVNFGLVGVKVEFLMIVIPMSPGDGSRSVGRIGLKVCRGGNITTISTTAPATAGVLVARAIPADVRLSIAGVATISARTTLAVNPAIWLGNAFSTVAVLGNLAVGIVLAFSFARRGAIRITTQPIAMVILAVTIQIGGRLLISEVAFVVAIICDTSRHRAVW